MKNKLVVAIIAVLVLGIGGYGIYRVIKHFARLANSSPAQTANIPRTLKDLLGLGTAQKCTYPGGQVFVAGGKVRGNFSETVNGKTTSSHIIVNGNTSYIWTDGQMAGFKTSFNVNATTAPVPSSTSSPEAGQSGNVSAEQPQDYQCSGWTADPIVFELPKGVTFQDMSSLIPSAMPQTQGSGNPSQCSYCDNLSGSDKTQCLTALNCK